MAASNLHKDSQVACWQRKSKRRQLADSLSWAAASYFILQCFVYNLLTMELGGESALSILIAMYMML